MYVTLNIKNLILYSLKFFMKSCPYSRRFQIYFIPICLGLILEPILLYRTCFDCKRQAFKLSELFIRSEGNQTTMPLYELLS